MTQILKQTKLPLDMSEDSPSENEQGEPGEMSHHNIQDSSTSPSLPAPGERNGKENGSENESMADPKLPRPVENREAGDNDMAKNTLPEMQSPGGSSPIENT
ncbi:hypothetical protein R1flu_005757 [Riccia fluitans]|uniref:Uncharacterized protein n=1 Tax=Riccia fluitans TaxID=41844 RepID=A0ABD1YU38_9MARC